MSLQYIGQQIATYAGSLLVITGVFGNGMNIIIFSSTKNYRANPSTFYILIASIFNVAYLILNLIPRIVISGVGFDLTKVSTNWCKMRQFFLYTLDIISLGCSCLATIDQFFVTSQSARLRQLSNIKWARLIAVIVIVIGFVQDVPYVFTHHISPITGACSNTNPTYTIYTPVHVIGLICLIPVSVMVIFGYLGYRNIRLTRILAEQRADRQLMRIVLIQMTFAIICFIPYGSNNAYTLLTSTIKKDSNRSAIESFASTMISLLFYCYFAGTGYMFIISSRRFRQEVKKKISFCLRLNRIEPAQQNTLEPTIAMNKTTRY